MCKRGNFIIFCAVLFLCLACTKEQPVDTYLQLAMQTVDEHPKEALLLLDEIPYPELTDRDNYMQYVVTLTQARYMNDQDITGDTLILEAQRYFTGTDNPEMATRASFYAAAYWREKEEEDKALEYYLLTNYYAQKVDNYLFQAKSTHWIGSTYYNRDILDSARVYYHQAETLYSEEANTELQQLDIKYMLGRTYLELEQYNLALIYLNEGLEKAQQSNNQLYKYRFEHYKGVVFRERKEYQQAKEYFNLVLSQKMDAEDFIRLCLDYVTLYRMCNQPDSAKHYLDLVKNRVEELSFPYNRKTAYKELAFYYEKEGNITQMKRYLQLVTKEELLIKDLQSEKKIQAANERFEASQRKIELAKQQYNRTWKISLTVVIVLLLLFLIFWQNRVKLKERYKEIRKRYFTHKLYMEEYLAKNLNYISASIKELSQRGEPVLPHSATWKHFQNLRTNTYIEIEAMMREMFEKTPQGLKALSLLKLEDLCIIFLCRRNMYTDNSIKYMLGYEHDATCDIRQRKYHIREILTTAGLKKREINRVFLDGI